MKKLLYLFLLLLPILSFAQSRYGVEGVPVCWRTPLGVDSSLNRYVIISSTGKPVQTIVYENANGVVVNVSGGSMRYGYCDCIDFTVPDSSITWAMLTQPVKDSIRHKRDTFITVPPNTNYFQNNIDNPAKFYNNIYFSCKGRTDTSIVVFLAAPIWEEQKGVVYHIKNDSGLVAAFVINYEHLSNNKRFYLLQRGQTAQVRLLPDAANGGNYRWAVNVVWDSTQSAKTIYTASDTVRNNVIVTVKRNKTLTIGEGSDVTAYGSGGVKFLNVEEFGEGEKEIHFGVSSNYLGGGRISGKLTPYGFYAEAYNTSNVLSAKFNLGDNGSFFGHFNNNSANLYGGISLWGNGFATSYANTPSNSKMANFTSIASSATQVFSNMGYRDVNPSIYSFNSGIGRVLNYTSNTGPIRNNGNINFYVQTATESTFYDWISVDLDIVAPSSGQNRVGLYNRSYYFSNSTPNSTPSAISTHIQTGNGINATPSFLRSQHKTTSGTTDGIGDITITFDAAMPDATYTVIVTGQGETPYVYMTQSATLATGSVKVRMFTLAGAAATSTAYQISYEVKDTN